VTSSATHTITGEGSWVFNATSVTVLSLTAQLQSSGTRQQFIGTTYPRIVRYGGGCEVLAASNTGPAGVVGGAQMYFFPLNMEYLVHQIPSGINAFGNTLHFRCGAGATWVVYVSW
jgi:hypothetical protein